jgi:hypothetical protein
VVGLGTVVDVAAAVVAGATVVVATVVFEIVAGATFVEGTARVACGLPEDEHDAPITTIVTSATHRPGTRRTPS